MRIHSYVTLVHLRNSIDRVKSPIVSEVSLVLCCLDTSREWDVAKARLSKLQEIEVYLTNQLWKLGQIIVGGCPCL